MCIDLGTFVYKLKIMRTNIDIDDDLMKKAFKYSKLKTKKEIINKALTEYVKYQMRLKLLSLKGKVKWEGDLDKMRTYDKGEIILNKSLKQKVKNYENKY